jgi:hypothetical protein
MKKLTDTQRRLFEAIRAGADLRLAGWQQIRVTFGPRDSRNYVAMQATLYALRDRKLIELGDFGVRLAP